MTARNSGGAPEGTGAPEGKPDKDPPKEKPAAKDEEKRLTPEGWRNKLKTKPEVFAAANQLHGWAQHAYHFSTRPLLLSREDYDQALKAGGEFPTCPPHAPALGERRKEKFKDFKPLKSTAQVKKEAEDAAKEAAKKEKG